jgi:hypothetical protein
VTLLRDGDYNESKLQSIPAEAKPIDRIIIINYSQMCSNVGNHGFQYFNKKG